MFVGNEQKLWTPEKVLKLPKLDQEKIQFVQLGHLQNYTEVFRGDGV